MSNNKIVELGDLAEDIITGFEGIVVAETNWINGCTRHTLQSPTLGKDGLPTENQCFDTPNLCVVKKEVVARGPFDPGGPRPAPKQNPNPQPR